MKVRERNKIVMTVLGWGVAFVVFFPILWMVITSFKTEIDAIRPSLIFQPTLENFSAVNERVNYFGSVINSVVESLGATLICLAFAMPAAYAMAFYPGRKTKDLLMWMMSTKMMPAVGVLLPIYLIMRTAHLLDSVAGLIIVYTLMNLPIAVWMTFTYFCEVPAAILEAARVDGASLGSELRDVLAPMSLPGISSTALLLIILSWNEAFWSLNLTSANAAPLTVFIASYSSPEGLFWAKLSAASLLAVAPIMVMGWLSQKQLVSGLTFGAVK